MTKVNAEDVVQYKQDNPRSSIRAISEQFHISHQRIHQILVEAKIDTRHHYIYKYHCIICGKTLKHHSVLTCGWNTSCYKQYMKQKMVKLSKIEIQNLITDKLNGIPTIAICDKYHISQATMYRYISTKI
jgi:hypothetical protein